MTDTVAPATTNTTDAPVTTNVNILVPPPPKEVGDLSQYGDPFDHQIYLSNWEEYLKYDEV